MEWIKAELSTQRKFCVLWHSCMYSNFVKIKKKGAWSPIVGHGWTDGRGLHIMRYSLLYLKEHLISKVCMYVCFLVGVVIHIVRRYDLSTARGLVTLHPLVSSQPIFDNFIQSYIVIIILKRTRSSLVWIQLYYILPYFKRSVMVAWLWSLLSKTCKSSHYNSPRKLRE
jgi:hypothetical protein